MIRAFRLLMKLLTALGLTAALLLSAQPAAALNAPLD